MPATRRRAFAPLLTSGAQAGKKASGLRYARAVAFDYPSDGESGYGRVRRGQTARSSADNCCHLHPAQSLEVSPSRSGVRYDRQVVKHVILSELLDENTWAFINPTGRLLSVSAGRFRSTAVRLSSTPYGIVTAAACFPARTIWQRTLGAYAGPLVAKNIVAAGSCKDPARLRDRRCRAGLHQNETRRCVLLTTKVVEQAVG